MSRIRSVLVVLFICVSLFVKANEGMWLPLLLEKLNEKEMKSLGMKISARDIYNVNAGSLKDAIVSFGGFCTGEVISTKGLVLTNHHCGLEFVQDHSTVDRNLLRDGFWAKSYAEELPNAKLFVTFIVRIEDVTRQVLNGANPSMSERERQSLVDRNINELKKTVNKASYQDILVRPFFEANQYYLFVTETYRDVRLVGAPPNAIGNFGQDTDNWMWPRHTGDFSMFRIYAGKDNKPAEYSPDNIPYTPKKSLAISLDGVAEGDFTMVFGFPGRTSEYLHSEAIRQTIESIDPVKVSIRDKALAVMDNFMRKDEQIKIQYTKKYARLSNYWKKWKGEMLGLQRSNAVEKRRLYESTFQKRVEANPEWKAKYGTLLEDLRLAYQDLEPLGRARDYYQEVTGNIEIFTVISQLDATRRVKNNGTKYQYSESLSRMTDYLDNLYKNYNPAVDKKLFEVLMEMYVTQQPAKIISPKVATLAASLGNDFSKMADQVMGGEDLSSPPKAIAALKANPAELMERAQHTKVAELFMDMANTYQSKIANQLNELQARINQLQRLYMQAQMEVMKEKKFYPDANSTLRVTYGPVRAYSARDGVKYDYRTYLDGVMEKYVPGDYEFDVPEKLRALYRNKDYGQYGVNGKMPVCFIATNHTTGGNSGSPALDAYGNLVGLNFDRAWEGTMSDINYDPAICRNIMVDIRYILFIVDKYGGAGHLVKEMKLVHPKKK